MEKEIKMRYWQAFRIAIENFTAETNKPYEKQNGTLIRCLARVVRARESELDQVEKKAA